MICHHCQKPVEITKDLVGRRDECPHCRYDLRCCKNCEFFDVKAYNECREPSADRVLEKERSNFCDFFKPSSKKSGVQAKLDPLAAAQALFKKKS